MILHSNSTFVSKARHWEKAKEDWQSYQDKIGLDSKASAAKVLRYLDELGECTNWPGSSYLQQQELHKTRLLVLQFLLLSLDAELKCQSDVKVPLFGPAGQ